MVKKLAEKIYKGKFDPTELDPFLLAATYKELEESTSTGYGDDWKSFEPRHSATVNAVKEHLFIFSGAKTYQQLSEMNNALVDAEGKIRNFREFQKEVLNIHSTYNKNYLQAEYQTAKASGQMIRKWQTFQDQRAMYPNLTYITVGDDKVREDHRKLEGITRSIDDIFWDLYYPPNGWRDRCGAKNTSNAETPSGDIPIIEVTKGFEHNVGKTLQVFNEKSHPYFTIPKDEKEMVEKNLSKYRKSILKNGSK